jgi:hypothetical protein
MFLRESHSIADLVQTEPHTDVVCHTVVTLLLHCCYTVVTLL